MGKSNLYMLKGEGAVTVNAFSIKAGERTSLSRPEESFCKENLRLRTKSK